MPVEAISQEGLDLSVCEAWEHRTEASGLPVVVEGGSLVVVDDRGGLADTTMQNESEEAFKRAVEWP
jgi:hypothetical protein